MNPARQKWDQLSPAAHDLLSPREHEIARMVGQGYTNRAIARVLDISLYTVSAHMRRIFTKLGVGTRAAMVAALSGQDSLAEAADGGVPALDHTD